MPKITEKQRAQWEKTRNIGEEVLGGIRDIKAGRVGRRYTIHSYPIIRAREKSGLSQAQFAHCSESQCAHSRTGSKVAANQALPRRR